MAKRAKRRGHYCWSCGSVKANERFSGRGHAAHVCKQCRRLGSEELARRQAMRNIDQLLNWGGGIRRNQRKTFEGYLRHADPKVRSYAESILASSTRRPRYEDDDFPEPGPEDPPASPRREGDDGGPDEEIPF